MIIESVIHNGGIDIAYRVGQSWVDVLGPHRMDRIDDVLFNSLQRQIHSSYWAAATGALRHHQNFRPEVLIDATGRLL